MKQWLHEVVNPDINGLGGGDIYSTIAKVVDDFDRDGYVLGLDYQKAFDCLDPSVSNHLLKAFG